MRAQLDNLLLACVFLLVVFVIAAAAHLRVQAHHERRRGHTPRVSRRRPRRDSVLPESFWDIVFPPTETLCANILAGVVAGVKQCLGCVVFSSMVYNGCDACYPELQSVFPIGVSVNLMSTVLGVFLCTFMSNYGGQVSPQDIPAMLLSRIAEILALHVDEDELESTILAVTWINATVFGILLLFCGKFRAGRIMRSFPCPVVDGFVAATGAMAVRSALATLCRTSFHNLWPSRLDSFAHLETWLHILVGLASVFCIRYLSMYIKAWIPPSNKAVNALLNPLCLLVPLIVFYLILLVRGNVSEDLAFLRDKGLVYPKVSNQPFWKFYSSCYPNSHFQQVRWAALLNTEVLLLMAMLQFLSLIAAVLSLVGMKARISGLDDMNLDDELFRLGVQNLVIGAAGGSLSFHKLGVSVNLVKDGGTHRIADLVAGVFTAVVFLSGVPVSPFIPKFFLAAIFLNLGIEFTKDHLFDKFGRMGLTDFGTTLVVVLLAMTRDMTWAVGGGLVLQVAILVMISSTLDPVRLQATTDTMMSTRLRTVEERRMLMQSQLIEVICLRGPLFFGIAAKLILQIEELLYTMEPLPLHIILSLDQVTALDHSAAEAFMKIHQTAAKRGIVLNIVGADEWKWLLVREGIIASSDESSKKKLKNVHDYASLSFALTPEDQVASSGALARWFQSLDDALYDCEDRVLDVLEGESVLVRSASGHRYTCEMEIGPNGQVRPKVFVANSIGELEDEDLVAMSGMSAEEWRRLMDECESLWLQCGDRLYQSGDRCKEVYILTDGCIKLTPSNSYGVPRQVSALGLIGAEALILRLALREEEAEVTSEEGALVHKLTQEKLEYLKQRKPDLYISFADLRARALCTSKGPAPPL